MLLLRCPTEHAVLLLGLPDARGVLRFAPASSEILGVPFRPGPVLPINAQILAVANQALGMEIHGPDLDICQEYTDRVVLEGAEACLYLAIFRSQQIVAPDSWQSLPSHLRQMVRGPNRLAYLRAWQVMTGSLTLDTKAIETNDLSKL